MVVQNCSFIVFREASGFSKITVVTDKRIQVEGLWINDGEAFTRSGSVLCCLWTWTLAFALAFASAVMLSWRVLHGNRVCELACPPRE